MITLNKNQIHYRDPETNEFRAFVVGATQGQGNGNQTGITEISATTPPSAGWYRIATSENVTDCIATFEIVSAATGYHTAAMISVSISYGFDPNVTVLQCSQYTTNSSLTKVRIVYAEASNKVRYLEVYNPRALATKISIKTIGETGWTFISPTLADESIPSGYSVEEVELNGRILAAPSITASDILKGNTLIIGSTDGESHLTFSRGSFNYITAPVNGKFAFVTNGQEINTSNSELIIEEGKVYPGTTDSTILGRTDNKWSNVYATKFTGDLIGKADNAKNADTATVATQVNVAETNPESAMAYYPLWTAGFSKNTNYAANANNGFKYETLEGSESAIGYGRVTLGNGLTTGEAGNKYGMIRLYSQDVSYSTIRQADTASPVAHWLPDVGGTILNTGTTSFTQNIKFGTAIGTLKINGIDNIIYSPGTTYNEETGELTIL